MTRTDEQDGRTADRIVNDDGVAAAVAAVSVAARHRTKADHTGHYFPILIVTFGLNSSSNHDDDLAASDVQVVPKLVSERFHDRTVGCAMNCGSDSTAYNMGCGASLHPNRLALSSALYLSPKGAARERGRDEL